MKFAWVILIIIFIFAGYWIFFVNKNIGNMQIKSQAFADNGKIPAKYTCDGDNISPLLSISEVPENAESLVLILDDPDAPRGTFNHWVVWNIPTTASEIKEGAKVEGIEGMNSGGKTGYFGPCPPSGTHRYIFKLYALDTELNIGSDSKSSDVKEAMQGHVLEEAQTTGLYR